MASEYDEEDEYVEGSIKRTESEGEPQHNHHHDWKDTNTPHDLYYYNECTAPGTTSKLLECDEQINLACLYECPDLTKCPCILKTPPLQKKLIQEGDGGYFYQTTAQKIPISECQIKQELLCSVDRVFENNSLKTPGSNKKILGDITNHYNRSPIILHKALSMESPSRLLNFGNSDSKPLYASKTLQYNLSESIEATRIDSAF